MGLATAKLLLEMGNDVVSGDMNGSPVNHANLTFLETDVTIWDQLKTSSRKPQTNTAQDPPGGSIVCTASASSFQRFGVTGYTTAKRGVFGWMRGMVANLQEHKVPIRINCIGLSWTVTGLVPKEKCDEADLETQTAEVVAELVAYLIADETRHGQFVFSASERLYEMEESRLLPAVKDGRLMPAAKEISGGGRNTEEEAYERLRQVTTCSELGQPGKAQDAGAAAFVMIQAFGARTLLSTYLA
ncbi:Hypothetical predicted protein [Lecanosticta acicola]|uniref:NAD(P)-binding protein n=1 Tax=Lecanosticta acicola TaxID=111012 RepID=A0AAI9E7J3_9PEZI|nr:Hypothetical predicted protein [Lecanosticta acicola]